MWVEVTYTTFKAHLTIFHVLSPFWLLVARERPWKLWVKDDRSTGSLAPWRLYGAKLTAPDIPLHHILDPSNTNKKGSAIVWSLYDCECLCYSSYITVAKKWSPTLIGVAQLVGHSSAKCKATGKVPWLTHACVAGQVPGWGHARGSPSVFLSLSFSLPSPLSKNK